MIDSILQFKKTLIKNVFLYSVGNVVNRVLKFLLIPFVIRTLGPLDFGLFNYGFYIITACFIFYDIGLTDILVRDINQRSDERDSIFQIVLTLKVGLFIVSLACAFIVFLVLNEPVIRMYYLLFLAYVMLDKACLFFNSILISYGYVFYLSLVSIIQTAILVGLCIFYLSPEKGLFVYLCSLCVSQLFCFCLFVYKVSRILDFRLKWDLGKGIYFLKAAYLNFGLSMIGLLLVTSDSLMVKWFLDVQSLGYYQAAYKIVGLSMIFSSVFSPIVFPILSKWILNKIEFEKLVKRLFSIYWLISIPILIGGVFLSKELILYLYTSSYLESVNILQVLMFWVFSSYLLTLFNSVILVLGVQNKSLKITASVLCLNIILNCILIGPYGILGIAAGTSISRFCELIFIYRLVKNETNLNVFVWIDLMKPIIAIIFMGIAIYFIDITNLPILVMIGGGVYFFALVALREKNTIQCLELLYRKIVFRVA